MQKHLELMRFRAALWQEFVASYQLVTITTPDLFSAYCEKFRQRYLEGK